jgi:uncharacterized OB-fold protein
MRKTMMANEKKQVPVRAGLWTTPLSPNEKPQLMGSQCPACGEVYFPKRERGICIHCGHRGLDDVKLNRRGKIHSFSVVMQQPTQFFLGKAPYAYGWIDLPDVRLRAMFTGCDFKDLKLGMPVELVIEKLGEDEQGNEVVAHKFRPVQE